VIGRAARSFIVAAWLIATFAQAHAEHPEIAKRRAAERKSFTDAEIYKGFFLTAFGAEMRIAGRVDGIRKYVVPVRVFVENRARPDRVAQVATVVADIQSRIANIDIAITQDRKAANIVVRLLHERDFAPTLRKAFGRGRAGKIQKSLEPQCLSGFRKDAELRIVHSDVFLVADRGDFIFYDCVYEELLQSLGPINDTDKVPWTMFNDDVQMGFFDVYDQYILNILYHPKVRPGMTREQVRALLPEIMPEVRAFVAKTNDLPR
jgi:Protein of unknown function (DUF2927)